MSILLTAEQVRVDFWKTAGTAAPVIRLFDSKYIAVDLDFLLEDFHPFFQRYLEGAKLQFRGESMDCDDFSRVYKTQLLLAGVRNRTKDSDKPIMVGLAKVFNMRDSLDIGPGLHCVVVVGTRVSDKLLWLVVEPQNQKYVHLQNYKNARIDSIDF